MYKIIYEDEDILALDKPAGISVHSDDHHTEGTLLDEVRKHYSEAELGHRLDKDTSGILLVAKNHKSYEYIKTLFVERNIQKTYIALVVGEVAKNEGIIDLPIGRSTKDFRKRVASPVHKDGIARPAETHYKVVKKFPSYTLLEVQPKTGRTHQIRSHLASIGYPVACDKLYGGKRYMCPEGLNRQFLHALRLEFTNRSGKRLMLEAGVPEELERVLAALAKF